MTETMFLALHIIEVGASVITAFSLLAIAIHEIGGGGPRRPRHP